VTRKRLVAVLVLVPLAPATVAAIVQAVATMRDRGNLPPPGRLLDVGGRRLHLDSMGQGAPAVILEAGLGGICSSWGWVQPEVARFTRVIAYDRAGLGWSDPAARPRDAMEAVRDLHALLAAARVPRPYVVVGYSFGGLLARAYARQHPREVSGMVLVDSSHPDQALRIRSLGEAMETASTLYQAGAVLGWLGLPRLAGLFHGEAEGLPPRRRAEVVAAWSSWRHLRATRDEAHPWEDVCAQVRGAGTVDVPLEVVSAGAGSPPGWHQLQAELAALSSRGTHRVVEGASHLSLLADHGHARATAEAVRRVVDAARSGVSGRPEPPAP